MRLPLPPPPFPRRNRTHAFSSPHRAEEVCEGAHAGSWCQRWRHVKVPPHQGWRQGNATWGRGAKSPRRPRGGRWKRMLICAKTIQPAIFYRACTYIHSPPKVSERQGAIPLFWLTCGFSDRKTNIREKFGIPGFSPRYLHHDVCNNSGPSTFWQKTPTFRVSKSIGTDVIKFTDSE